MTDYSLTELGALARWHRHRGGFRADTQRDGRRIVERELDTAFLGITANALRPGESAGYWHVHAEIEELYVFLGGTGQMGLDDTVVDVRAGTAIRVGAGVWRTWRCVPESSSPLQWLCIRGSDGGFPSPDADAIRDDDRPEPWPGT